MESTPSYDKSISRGSNGDGVSATTTTTIGATLIIVGTATVTVTVTWFYYAWWYKIYVNDEIQQRRRRMKDNHGSSNVVVEGIDHVVLLSETPEESLHELSTRLSAKVFVPLLSHGGIHSGSINTGPTFLESALTPNYQHCPKDLIEGSIHRQKKKKAQKMLIAGMAFRTAAANTLNDKSTTLPLWADVEQLSQRGLPLGIPVQFRQFAPLLSWWNVLMGGLLDGETTTAYSTRGGCSVLEHYLSWLLTGLINLPGMLPSISKGSGKQMPFLVYYCHSNESRNMLLYEESRSETTTVVLEEIVITLRSTEHNKEQWDNWSKLLGQPIQPGTKVTFPTQSASLLFEEGDTSEIRALKFLRGRSMIDKQDDDVSLEGMCVTSSGKTDCLQKLR